MAQGDVPQPFSPPTDAQALYADGKWLTYGDLDWRSAALTLMLRGLGLSSGDRFAFALPNGPDILACYVACARSGMVGVPLSQRLTPREFAFQVRDSAAKALLVSDQFAVVAADTAGPGGGGPLVIQDQEVAAAMSASGQGDGSLFADNLLRDPADPFLVMYTGGTSGRPKAAIQTRESWHCCLEASIEQWQLTTADRHLIALPMSHAAWFTAGASLGAGGTVSIMRSWDPDEALDLVARNRITTLNMIPTMLGDLLQAQEARPRDVRSVRLLTVAGSVLPADFHRRTRALFGDVLGNIYGLTEAAGPVTFLLPADMSAGKSGTVGRPSRYVDLAILDAQMRPTNGSEPGEVGLAGPQITPGYLGSQEETRAAFAGRWFLTGDIGRLDADGFLSIVGRKKEMIKTGGYNVYPSEVEEVLCKQSGVLECVVFGMPDDKWTEAVHAAVVLASGQQRSEAEIVADCRAELAGHKVPKTIHFMRQLPRTRFGKFDRLRLRNGLIEQVQKL